MYLVFKNKKLIAVALSKAEAELLAAEYELAVGASSRVSYRIVKVENSDFIENIA
jgi:hypothetical protein